MSAEASLGDLLAELLDEVDDVEMLADREYARNGVAFAARTAENVIELRLRPDVADAALRTPDTRPSERGEEWVAFAATDWNDPLARDRLVAWFRLAWRAAGS
jgi:hypothetical protein